MIGSPTKTGLRPAGLTAVVLFVLGQDAATCLGGALGAFVGLQVWAWSRAGTPAGNSSHRRGTSPARGRRRAGAYALVAFAAVPLAIAGILQPRTAAVPVMLLLVLAARSLPVR